MRNWFIGHHLNATSDEFERAKITLLFNFTFFFWLIAIGFIGKLVGDGLFWQVYITSFGLFGLCVVLLAIRFSKNYLTAAWMFLCLQIIMEIGNTILMEGHQSFVGTAFTLCNLMWAFFVLGRKGGLILAGFAVIMIVWRGLHDFIDVDLMPLEVPPEQMLKEDIFVAFVPFSLCFYILWQYSKSSSSAQVEIKEQRHHLTEKNREITDSINYAKKIQTSILPPDEYVKKLLPDSFILYLPKDIVSGDFYWLDQLNGKVLFSAVDCTGHGVPGAMMSVIGLNILQDAVHDRKLDQPAAILRHLDQGVSDTLRQQNQANAKDGMDLGLCSLDYSTRTLEYAGAYNPMYIVSEGQLTQVKADKLPIGSNPDGIADVYTNHTFQLKQGDCVYLLSDGYADQFGGPKGKKFMYKRLRALLEEVHHQSMEEQHQRLVKEFRQWMGEEEQVDDVCIIGVKV